MKTGKQWVFGIIAFLAANVTASVLLAVLAHGQAESRTTAAYDEAAVGDRTAEARTEKARALRWTIEAQLAHGQLEITVRDAAGAAITGAQVHVRGAHRAFTDSTIDTELAAGAGGELAYLGPGPTRKGWYDVRVTVARGADTDERELAVEAR